MINIYQGFKEVWIEYLSNISSYKIYLGNYSWDKKKIIVLKNRISKKKTDKLYKTF